MTRAQALAQGGYIASGGAYISTFHSLCVQILRRYAEAYARKDLDGMVAEWHPLGPARERRNVILVESDLREIQLTGLTVQARPEPDDTCWHLMIVRTDARDELHAALAGAGRAPVI